MKINILLVVILLTLASRAHAAPRFSYECDATYLTNLYWTVANLADPNSDYSKYWERKFGFSAEDREALDKLGQTLQRLRGRYKVWENDSVLTPLASGPMVGLFIAPMSSYEQRVQVAMATTDDLGTVRGKMPDLSFAEINAVAGTCGRFLGKFDSIWEGLSRTPTQSATRVTALLKQREQKIDDFIVRASRVYGVAASSPSPLPRQVAGEGGGARVQFKAHFLWSPRQVGGQCTLVENHIFCETSEREDPQRYLLGLLHETCHYLSATVAPPTKYRRSEAMLENGIYFPLQLVEESLAASLAQGIGAKLITPTLFKPGAQWVGHLDGKVDTVAKAFLPKVQRLYDDQETLDASRMRELAAVCVTALAPRPRDYTNVCLVTGRKDLRDYLRVGISQGTGLRYGMEFAEVAQAQDLPAWFNRVFLVSAGADLDSATALPSRWSLPLDRMEFEELRAKHDHFIYTRRDGPRVEFVLYASDDAGLKRVIDHFKRLDKLTVGLSRL